MVSKRLMIGLAVFSMLLVVIVSAQHQDKKPASDLFKAILDGQTQTALALINQGVDVNAKDTTATSTPGSTALMYAAWKGDTVTALLQKGVDVNAKNKYGLTALLRAMNKGHVLIIKALLKQGANIEAKDTIVGMTPLMSAAWNGDTTIMQILLANGANINEQDRGGNTALMDAVIGGHMAATQILLAKGADVTIKNKNGKTALMAAEKTVHPEIGQLLKQAGAKE